MSDYLTSAMNQALIYLSYLDRFMPTVEANKLNPKRMMNINLAAQFLLGSAFFITSIFLARTANMGFGVVVTALTYIGFSCGGIWVINSKQDAVSVGLIIGFGAALTLMSLVTAVFWGELSRCEEIALEISKYTCDHKAAMITACIFATFMFLLQGAFTLKLHLYKTYILAESLQYAEVPAGAHESDEMMIVMDKSSWGGGRSQNSIIV